MTWGTFTPVHILSLLLAAGAIVGLYFILKNKSRRTQKGVLGVLSFAGIAAIVFNLLAWDSPLEYLPLHLCSLTALVLPLAVWTGSRTLHNLLLLWSLGVPFALVVNTAQADFEIFSWTFFFYYVPHVLEWGVVILLFVLRHARADARYLLSTVAITLLAYTLAHGANVWINAYCLAHQVLNPSGEVIKVNYMFSVTPENPLLQAMYDRPYWYMYKVIPLIVVYLGAVYLGQYLARRCKNRL